MALTIKGTSVTAFEKGPNAKDGEDCGVKPVQSVYEGLGWNFSGVWKMGTDGYPALRWQW
jgi:hypothetical protein